MTEDEQRELIAQVESRATLLCESIKRANSEGVPDSLLLPALVAVFREAGMIPDIDLGDLMGMLR